MQFITSYKKKSAWVSEKWYLISFSHCGGWGAILLTINFIIAILLYDEYIRRKRQSRHFSVYTNTAYKCERRDLIDPWIIRLMGLCVCIINYGCCRARIAFCLCLLVEHCRNILRTTCIRGKGLCCCLPKLGRYNCVTRRQCLWIVLKGRCRQSCLRQTFLSYCCDCETNQYLLTWLLIANRCHLKHTVVHIIHWHNLYIQLYI